MQIIVRLTDGIGNQLFQVANAIIYANEKNRLLKVDQNSFFGCKSSKNKLMYFKLKINIASRTDLIKSSPLFILPNFIINILTKIFRISRIKKLFIHQKSLHSPVLINKFNSSYFFDYYQISINFDKYRKLLLDNFDFNIAISEKALTYKIKIQNSNSLGIHFRRGDYLNKDNAGFYNLLKEQYYLNALSYAKENIEKPFLFLFSDDIDWVKKNFNMPFTNLLYVESDSDIEDLYLMSLCSNIIISNSTFSWWGAWLNKNDSKIVIYPKDWYQSKKMNQELENFIPNSWIKI